MPLVTQLYPPQIAERIGEIAHDAGAIWEPRGLHWDAIVRQDKLRYRDRQGELDLPLPRLPGKHQALNAALAVAMLRHQQLSHSALGAQARRWAGRTGRRGCSSYGGPLFDMLPKGSELWVDGGHNPSAARLVADHAKKYWPDGLPLVLLFASLQSKDAAGALRPFKGVAAEVLTLPIEGHECRAPEELAALGRKHGPRGAPPTSLADAMTALRKPARVLVFGSLYLAGELLALERAAAGLGAELCNPDRDRGVHAGFGSVGAPSGTSSSVPGWRMDWTTKPRCHKIHSRIRPGTAATTVNNQKPTQPKASAK